MGLTVANKITICRIVVVPFFIAVVLYYSPQKDYLRFVALILFIFASVSDLIDGYVARTQHQKTMAGAMLDPLADKLLLISAFICLYKVGILFSVVKFPVWLVVGVISRDVILLIGAMLIYVKHGGLIIEPTKIGKVCTFFQSVAVIGILLQWSFSIGVWYITITLTAVSAIDYIRKGMKILNDGTGG